MSDTATARAIQLDLDVEVDDAPTTRRPALRVIENRTWDDVPAGPVPAEVIRYFEEAIAREEERRMVRGSHETLI